MKFERQTFKGGVITLDYNEFIDCAIVDCQVNFHGGTFSLVRTTLSNVRFGFVDAANNTLNFMRLVRATGPHLLDEVLNQQPPPASSSLNIN